MLRIFLKVKPLSQKSPNSSQTYNHVTVNASGYAPHGEKPLE
jgi:hypothetical protein